MLLYWLQNQQKQSHNQQRPRHQPLQKLIEMHVEGLLELVDIQHPVGVSHLDAYHCDCAALWARHMHDVASRGMEDVLHADDWLLARVHARCVDVLHSTAQHVMFCVFVFEALEGFMHINTGEL